MAKRPDLVARNKARATHRLSKSSTYAVWRSMVARCTKESRKDFVNYGGRGISVSKSWLLFENFLSDMGLRPPGLSLERKDNNRGYEKDNCVWATVTQQARNRRGNVLLTFNNETKNVSAWAETVGLERKTLEYRIRVGWATEKALTTPSLTNRKRTHV